MGPERELLFPNKPLLIMSAALVDELRRPLKKFELPFSRVAGGNVRCSLSRGFSRGAFVASRLGALSSERFLVVESIISRKARSCPLDGAVFGAEPLLSSSVVSRCAGSGGAACLNGLLFSFSRIDLFRVNKLKGFALGFRAEDGAEFWSRSPMDDTDNSEVEG